MEERMTGKKNGSGLAEPILKKYSFLSFSKIAYSRSRAKYIALFDSERIVSQGNFLTITKMARTLYRQYDPLDVVIRQPWDKLEKDDELFSKLVCDIVLRSSPCMVAFVPSMTVGRDGRRIDIAFSSEAATELFARLSLSDAIGNYFKEAFGIELTVRNISCAVSDGCAPAETLEQGSRENELFEMHLQKTDTQAEPNLTSITATAEEKPQQSPRIRAANATRRRGESKNPFEEKVAGNITFISDLKANTKAAIMGQIIESEVKSIKDGRFTVFEFTVYDGKAVAHCKIFAVGDLSAEQGKVGEDKWVKVYGELKYDKFRDDDLFNVYAVESCEPPKIREDKSEEKRIELHIHTNMSAQDGLSSASDIVKRAKYWGHRAVAITDHGVVQAFPEAANAGKSCGVKIIYGMEAYLVPDDKNIFECRQDYGFDDEFVVFDIETTGLYKRTCKIIEIGAVRMIKGKIVDTFSTFVDPEVRIPDHIVSLTNITSEMVSGAPKEKEALEAFRKFAGDACLVAHNAPFDAGFVCGNKHGISFPNDVIDSIGVAAIALPDMKTYKLNKIADHYRIPLMHHRAVNDATCTAQILEKMFGELKERGIHTVAEAEKAADIHDKMRYFRSHHAIILCKNQKGLRNLYELVSLGHLKYFHRRPLIPKSRLIDLREGLILGSACEQGELYSAIVQEAGEAEIERIAGFYDYLEIQPHCNNMFMVEKGVVSSKSDLDEINKKIYRLGKKLGKPTVATTDSHYLDEEQGLNRAIIMESIGFSDVDSYSDLSFKTTDRMLEEFSYLGEETAREVVIENPNRICDMTEEITLFPDQTAMPKVDGAEEEIMEIGYSRMKELYGDPLPERIEKRLDRELGSIVRNGFSVLYWIAMKLVKKSAEDGYTVGSRGSVGSSLAAYALDITEVNPLPPHYRCPKCLHSDFNIDVEQYGCGVDMPPAKCPQCGADMISDGYDIPFEVFLGIDADKVPDIDLNFSGENQPSAHRLVEQIFGKENVFRAGTISAIQDKTAVGFVRKYLEKRGINADRGEVVRLAKGCSGVKRTTGQHPGGMVIVPKDREVYEFTPIQKPADKIHEETITTHFDFNSMHDILIKLDILGHDNPTFIKLLKDCLGFDPMDIPLNDKDTLSLFSGTEALGLTPDQLMGIDVGTLGIPEFGTAFVRGMLKDTRPTTMSELVRISGLSHGTDVWVGNAKDLIDAGVAKLSETICTRDDIMNYLVRKGVEQRTAFFIMEDVRKGKWAKGKLKDPEKYVEVMKEAGVEDWFIDSCKKIKYMFPKSHAVAYVTMALRLAYCKVHHPKEFYAVYFTVRGKELDCSYVYGGKRTIEEKMNEIDAKGYDASATDANVKTALELAYEMYQRGIEFLPVDIYLSKDVEYTVEENGIRMPFSSVPMLGATAASALADAVAKKNFVSIEELRKQAKLSQNVVDVMKKMGSFRDIPDSPQFSMI